jgi:geranylgeranylglycerol-phosphate geranylgeranyltransferase
MDKLRAFIHISRPSNVLIAFLSVVIAAAVAGSLQPWVNVLLASFSAALITIGANVINDYFDISIDTINKPHRPLPSGLLSKRAALFYFILVYLSAWVLAFSISHIMFIIAFLIGILLFFYSFKLKRTVLWGNMVVSLSTAMAFIYGGLAVDRLEGTWFPAAFAFLYHFAREIIKDIQDMEGDTREGVVTFAIKYGYKQSLRLATIIFVILVVVTMIPYILDIYGIIYLLVIIFGIYPVLAFVVYRSWKYPDPHNLGVMSNILKANMLVGLMAIYFG